jgi:hypothetical protein
VKSVQQRKTLRKLQRTAEEIQLDLRGLFSFEAKSDVLELERPGSQVSAHGKRAKSAVVM